ncbi:hypothetical protein BDV12DRAFT_159743 [Aspergillus spectabilis]
MSTAPVIRADRRKRNARASCLAAGTASRIKTNAAIPMGKGRKQKNTLLRSQGMLRLRTC